MDKKEYIERDSIYRRVKERTNPYGKPTLDYKSGVKVLNMIKQEPAADVVEVRHGEWIKAGVGITERIVCSACNSSKGYFGRPPFCNQCGAKMDGKRKEQT